MRLTMSTRLDLYRGAISTARLPQGDQADKEAKDKNEADPRPKDWVNHIKDYLSTREHRFKKIGDDQAMIIERFDYKEESRTFEIQLKCGNAGQVHEFYKATTTKTKHHKPHLTTDRTDFRLVTLHASLRVNLKKKHIDAVFQRYGNHGSKSLFLADIRNYMRENQGLTIKLRGVIDEKALKANSSTVDEVYIVTDMSTKAAMQGKQDYLSENGVSAKASEGMLCTLTYSRPGGFTMDTLKTLISKKYRQKARARRKAMTDDGIVDAYYTVRVGSKVHKVSIAKPSTNTMTLNITDSVKAGTDGYPTPVSVKREIREAMKLLAKLV